MSRGRESSPFIRAALDQISELRDTHRAYLWWYLERAEHATHGAMLNRRGKAAKISHHDLIWGNRTFVKAYASEELLEWMEKHPRMTFEQRERTEFLMQQEEAQYVDAS